MKKLISLCFAFSLVTAGFSQFKIESGATVTFNGNATLVLQDVDLVNEGTINEGTSTIIFKGAANSEITSGGATLYNLSIEKDAGFNVTALDATVVSNELSFDNNDNKLKIGNFDLNLESAATITGADSDDYIVTDGTGEVVKEGLGGSGFTYPVGYDESTYNPIIISENGPSDDIGVRVLENALASGSTGAPLTDGVNASWEVTEATAGDSDLSVTAQWAASDEDGTFDRTDAGIAQHDSGTDWDLSPSNMGASAGANPYTLAGTGYSPGILTVGGEDLMNTLLVDIKINLQGAYDAGMMSDDLRSAGHLPSSTPYGSGRFTNEGRGGAETATSTAFDANGDDSVVDWVFVWLKDKTNPGTTIETKSALLQKDGDVVDLDGVSFLEIPGDADDYHIGIGHRNHLNARTASPVVGINESVATTFDFTVASSQATGTDPMADLGAGVFGLYGGNANSDEVVRLKPRVFPPPSLASDVTFILDTGLSGDPNGTYTGYSDSDLNMDGFVRLKPRIFPPPSLSSDVTFILDEVLLGDPNATKTQQF